MDHDTFNRSKPFAVTAPVPAEASAGARASVSGVGVMDTLQAQAPLSSRRRSTLIGTRRKRSLYAVRIFSLHYWEKHVTSNNIETWWNWRPWVTSAIRWSWKMGARFFCWDELRSKLYTVWNLVPVTCCWVWYHVHVRSHFVSIDKLRSKFSDCLIAADQAAFDQ